MPIVVRQAVERATEPWPGVLSIQTFVDIVQTMAGKKRPRGGGTVPCTRFPAVLSPVATKKVHGDPEQPRTRIVMLRVIPVPLLKCLNERLGGYVVSHTCGSLLPKERINDIDMAFKHHGECVGVA